MIKRIVFDFDGTIADTSELCLRCFHDAWEPHVGHKMTDEEILATYGLPEEGMIRKLKDDYPHSNIVAIDYDPGATKINQENRIKIMLANARQLAKQEK